MFTKLEIPKGARVTATVEAVVVRVGDPKKPDHNEVDEMNEDHQRLFLAIFGEGSFVFPNGLVVPKISSVRVNYRKGGVVEIR